MENELSTLPDAQINEESPRWNPTIKVVVGVLIIILFGLAAYAFSIVFVPLIIGSILAYVLNPVVKFIARITRLPKGLATAVVYLTLLALLVPIGFLAIPALIEQAVSFQMEIINYIRRLSTMSADTVELFGFQLAVGDIVNEVTAWLVGLLRAAAPGTIGLVLNAARTGVLVVFTFVIAFYLTRDSERVIAMFKGLVPPRHRADATRLLEEIDGVWSAFLRGQVILSLTVMVILTIISALLGLPQPLLLGIWGGLLEFLPSIGNMIWGATAITLAIIQGSSYLPFPPGVFVIIVIIAYVAFSQLDINVLIPNIIGGQVRLHPMVVLIGVIIGLTVGGVLGVALAAPTIASLRVIGRYIYAKLFDLDPFPMVGPPAASRQEREAEAERRASEAPSPPDPSAVIRRIRRRRRKKPTADTTFE